MDQSSMKTILVVEDDRSLLNAIKKKIEVSGMKALDAISVEGAMKILNENDSIAAIWLDHYLLGNQNGLDLVSQIKTEGSEFQNIPVFVVSNTATNDKVQSYLHLGIAKYFVKANCRLDDIIADIQSTIG